MGQESALADGNGAAAACGWQEHRLLRAITYRHAYDRAAFRVLPNAANSGPVSIAALKCHSAFL
jgi:hypothetical protein